MKRKNKRKAFHKKETKEALFQDFLADSSLTQYTTEAYEIKTISTIEDIQIVTNDSKISWLNVYGFNYKAIIKKIVAQNNLDEFINYLILESDHRNKVIELTDSFFLTLKSPYYVTDSEEVKFEQLMFIVGENYIWSIQEVHGDHFEHIRKRLRENLGIVRTKGADYLFYLLIEAIIDNYYKAYEKLNEANIGLDNINEVKPTPEFAIDVEDNKRELYQIKRATTSLNEAVGHLENMDFENFNEKYFTELREQIKMISDDIDYRLQHLESSLNLMFSIQSHRLNEIMGTLTIFSVIFIPLTFIAGIYGMNFKNMPELESQNGYFIVLGVMLILVLAVVYFMKKKGWFGN